MATNTRTGRRPARTKTAAKPKAVEEEIDELEKEEVEEEAPKPARRRKPAAKKAAPVEDDDDFEELEDEDEDDDDEEDEAPKAKKKAPPKRPAIEFGTQWLVEFIKEKTGKDYKPYDIRVLLRKMAKDGDLDREVGTDRGRYEFEGPKDPVVIAIMKRIKGGEVEKAKKASLDKLKDSQTKKRAAKAKAKDEDVEEEEVEDDDDFEELEDEDEDDE